MTKKYRTILHAVLLKPADRLATPEVADMLNIYFR
jgi:hypothetical protein